MAGRPLAVEPRELVGERVRLVEDAAERRPNSCGSRSWSTGKRRTVTPLICSTPAGQLILPSHVVARASGQNLDRRVTGEALGDVARVQLGAAVDVRAVALDDDRELHDSEQSGATSLSPVRDADGASARPDCSRARRLRLRRHGRRAPTVRRLAARLAVDAWRRSASTPSRPASSAATAASLTPLVRLGVQLVIAVDGGCSGGDVPVGTERPLRGRGPSARRSRAGSPSIRDASSGSSPRCPSASVSTTRLCNSS